MKNLSLNLVNSDNSDIDFKITQFPDGQQDVQITSIFKYTQDVQVRVLSHLNSFKDLELVVCSVKCLNNIGIKDVELYIPYLLGARSDRKFARGGVNYLKDIISPIINSLNLSKITVLDPHSDVSEAVLNNFHKEPNFLVASWALDKILENESKEINMNEENFEFKNTKIQNLLKEIGMIIKNVLPKEFGFNLMIFDYGNEGSMFYISSAKREDMLKVMREFIKKQGN
jgi:hypothetical protein